MKQIGISVPGKGRVNSVATISGEIFAKHGVLGFWYAAGGRTNFDCYCSIARSRFENYE